jgi:hypothetical protein
MRAYRYQAKVYQLFFKNKMITDRKKRNIKQSIYTSAGCIPKGLQRHYSFKNGIKKINQLQNSVPYNFVNFFHYRYLYSRLKGTSKNSPFPLYRRGIKGEAKQKIEFLEVP